MGTNMRARASIVNTHSYIQGNTWEHAPGPISFGVRRGSRPDGVEYGFDELFAALTRAVDALKELQGPLGMLLEVEADIYINRIRREVKRAACAVYKHRVLKRAAGERVAVERDLIELKGLIAVLSHDSAVATGEGAA